MGYSVRRAAHGGDRRHGRSLAETLTFGKDIDELYDEAVGPVERNPRPFSGEWGERASGVRYPTGTHWDEPHTWQSEAEENADEARQKRKGSK